MGVALRCGSQKDLVLVESILDYLVLFTIRFERG